MTQTHKYALAAGLVLGLNLGARAAAEPPVVLGIGEHEAAKYNVEFMQYGRMQPVYKENGIQASFFELAGFLKDEWSEEQLYSMLKQYHVVQLIEQLGYTGCAVLDYKALRAAGAHPENMSWFNQANEMWVGNVFVCDNPAVKLTLVVDGQADGAKPFIEVHNPTPAAITATVRSPANTPVFGGLTTAVKIPAGDSLRLRVNGKQFEAIP